MFIFHVLSVIKKAEVTLEGDNLKRFSKLLLDHKKTVLTISIILTVVFSVMIFFVSVDYNLVNYLPKQSHSTVSLDVMTENFDQNLPNFNVVVPDVSIGEALETKALIEKVEGVELVLWLDDTIDITDPLLTSDPDLTNAWYKDGNAFFSVVVDDGRLVEASDEIYAIIGEEGMVSGDGISTAAAQKVTMNEMPKIMAIAVPIVLAILFLSTSSYFEPVLFLAVIGISILLNEGSNIFLGGVSFVTRACSAILQLAVSMDYAVFLLHRFRDYRDDGMEIRPAMEKAMQKSAPAIFSSAMTTVFGFLVLVLMEFKIGVNLGLALAKGIFLSLIAVVCLLPVLAMYCEKLLDKTRHRSFFPSFKGFSNFAFKVCLPFSVVVILLIYPSFVAQGQSEFVYGSTAMNGPETRVAQDTEKILELFGSSNQMVVLVPKGNPVKENELINDLEQQQKITGITAYVELVGEEVPESFLPESISSNFVSDEFSRIILNVDIPDEGETAFNTVSEIREILDKHYPEQNYLVGASASNFDLMNVVTKDNDVVNIASMIAIFLVLVFTFKDITLPLILVVAIKVAININLAIPFFTGDTIVYIGYLIISSVQLGATVDYGILLATHYLDSRKVKPKLEAIKLALQTATPSILTPALILISACFSLGFVSTNGVISQLGNMLGRGAIISVVMVLFFVPAMFIIFDPFIKLFDKKYRKQRYHKDRKVNINEQ